MKNYKHPRNPIQVLFAYLEYCTYVEIVLHGMILGILISIILWT